MKLRWYTIVIPLCGLTLGLLLPSPSQTAVSRMQANPVMTAPLCNQIVNGQTIVWNANRACWRPITPPASWGVQ